MFSNLNNRSKFSYGSQLFFNTYFLIGKLFYSGNFDNQINNDYFNNIFDSIAINKNELTFKYCYHTLDNNNQQIFYLIDKDNKLFFFKSR